MAIFYGRGILYRMNNKKLYRSRKDRVLAGICGGIGEYLNIDPVLIRVIWLLAVLCSGIVPGVIAYIIFIFIIPEQPIVTPESHS